MSDLSKERVNDLARILWEVFYEKDPTGEMFYFFCTRLSVYPKFTAYGIDDMYRFNIQPVKTNNIYDTIKKIEEETDLPVYCGNA